MRIIREWIHRLFGIVRPSRGDEDLAEEVRSHIGLAADAGRRVGGATQAMDALRDQRGLPWLDDVTRDIRHGLRSLRRTPVFTAVALSTLALGIGANTAIFSIVNGVILRPLGYPQPEQLMYLTTRFPDLRQFWVSPPEYLEFRDMNRSFSAVGAYNTEEVNLIARDRPVRIRAAFVDEHLLNALGVQAAHGRLFTTGETDVTGPAAAPGQLPQRQGSIAILAHELWQTAFGGRPIVGETVNISGLRAEVIGIMPPGTDVMDHGIEIWLPLGLNSANRQNRGNHYLYLVGRLKEGVTAQSAQRELDSLLATWNERVGLVPETDHVFAPLSEPIDGHILQMAPLQHATLGGAGRAIWVLQAAVGLVLLIACANLANLLLARAETRRREFAVRAALGASRRRLLRQSMIEGALLSIVGAAVGLWFARVGVQVLLRAHPTAFPRTSEVAVDLPVLIFTLGLAAATGVLFGLAPIAHTHVTGLVTSLRGGGDRQATGARHRVRRGLVMVEVGLAVMLVIGAGLLVRTVYNVARVDAGFDRSRLVTFSLPLPTISYPQASARRQAYQRALAGLRGLPGVQAVTAMSGLPPMRPVLSNGTDIDNYTEGPDGPEENVDYYQFVMGDYFETMGIPIVAGRSFHPSDAASPGRVAVVNEKLVQTFWQGQNPIGQRLRPCCGAQIPWYTVIGVAKDVKQGGVDQEAGTELYFFAEQPLPSVPDSMNVVLRLNRTGTNAALPPAGLSDAIERVIRSVDPGVPVVRLRIMDDVFDEAIGRRRLLAQLLGVMAGLAMLLAAIGTYGVLSYMVAERRREIGIRIALGAARSSVLALVMKQGLKLTIIGLILGLAGALGLNRLIASLLFGVEPTDPVTLMAVVATITLVATFACWLPAWRASRLDPNIVLRAE